jgi:hypothetical protein
MASRIGEKVPGWVERMLIPTLESRTRSIVKEELASYAQVVDARFQAMNQKMEALDEKFETKFEALEGRLESRFDGLDAKIDSLEKQFPVVHDLAEIKARLAQVEKNQR